MPTENYIHVPRRVMGLRTRIKQRGKRVAKRVLRRFQGDASDISKPVRTRAHTAGHTNERDVGRRCTATGRRIGCLNGTCAGCV